MRIAVVINKLYGGGAERTLALLSQDWEAAGHTIDILTFSDVPPGYPHGGRHTVLGPVGARGVRRVLQVCQRGWRLRRWLLDHRPQQIIAFMESAGFPAVCAAASIGMRGRLITSVRNNPQMVSASHRILIRMLYRLPRRVVALSEGVRRALIDDFGLPPRRVRTILNPVFWPGAIPTIAPPKRPFLLSVGRLHVQKGMDRVIEAFAALATQWTGDLLILGEGEQRAALEAQVQALGLADRVHLLGFREDAHAWMRQAMGLVLASRYEGWCNVLVEAMAVGCPVLAMDAPYGPREVLAGGRYGLLVPADDVSALVAGMRRLIDEPKLRQRLRQRGCQRAQHFHPARRALAWIAC